MTSSRHRGASRAERENTLEAFTRRGRMGADGVELDVRRTPTGARGAPRRPSARRPRDRRDAGGPTCRRTSRRSTRRSTRARACASTSRSRTIRPTPTSTRPIGRRRGGRRARRRARAARRWLISSFRIETRRPLPQLAAGDPHGVAGRVSRRRRTTSIAPWRGAATRRSIPWDAIVDADARSTAAMSAGLAVNTWTCDDPSACASSSRWGIDGICTNVPDVARRRRSTAPTTRARRQRRARRREHQSHRVGHVSNSRRSISPR